MPLYIGDYLRDTNRLTTEQHGAYLLLIMDYWVNGAPPDVDSILAQICRLDANAWSIAKLVIKPFFTITDGKLTHPRIDREIQDARTKKLGAVRKAEAAAKARWDKENTSSIASSNSRGMLGDCPSPSPSQVNPKPSVSHEKIVFDGSSFQNVNGQLEGWKKAYPAVNVENELLKAAVWLIANPKNKKSNYARFLTNWISKAQDSAPRVQSASVIPKGNYI